MAGVTPKQLAVLERHAGAGADAREFLDRAALTCPQCGQGSTIFAERTQQTIKEAIAWFRSPSAASDSHVAVRYIAALAEIVALRTALEYRVAKAADATAALHGGAQTAG